MATQRWTTEKANAWFAKQGWLVGCNYIPATAINQIEMWAADTFDPATIRQELQWAAKLGFNTIRVFLHDLLWENDREAWLRRIDHFLSIADEYNIKTMLVIFDGVWDPYPSMAKREAKPYVHNSGWLQSPGAAMLTNLSAVLPQLEKYVKGIIERFSNDERILLWDLFNEPDNLNPTSYIGQEPDGKGELSLTLLEHTFAWARQVNPSQPLTAGLWYGDWSDLAVMKPMDRFMIMESDIISFHNYEGPQEMERRIMYLKQFGRPLLCSEYMARTMDNTFENILPIFKKHQVGCYNWGFVQGRTQTNCPWDSWLVPYSAEPPLWFHDIFRADGTPYLLDEVRFIQQITSSIRKTTPAH